MAELQPIRCANCGALVELDLHAMLDGVLHCAHCGAALAPPSSMSFDVRLDGVDYSTLIEFCRVLAACIGQPHAIGSTKIQFVDKVPCLVRCGASAKEAGEMRAKLQAAGGRVTVLPCPGHH